MADTVRYRALTRVTYARALAELVALARTHAGPEFSFGPMELGAMESGGLTVSGADLSGVTPVLAKVPGLVEVPA